MRYMEPRIMDDSFDVDDYVSPSFQPDLEARPLMHSLVVAEDSPLAGVVSDFLEFSTDFGEDGACLRFIPDSLTCVVVDLTRRDREAFLFTCVSSLFNLELEAGSTYFIARFFPGMVGTYLGIDIEQTFNRRYPLGPIGGNERCDALVAGVREAASFESRASSFESCLSGLIGAPCDLRNIIHFVRDRIIRSSGTINMARLSLESLYSCRYLRKLFDEHVGLSQKALCEIVRFQKSFVFCCGTNLSLCDIAQICGYYDNASMDKAYVSLAGLTPKKLKRCFSLEYLGDESFELRCALFSQRMNELRHSLDAMQYELESVCVAFA